MAVATVAEYERLVMAELQIASTASDRASKALHLNQAAELAFLAELTRQPGAYERPGAIAS